ncbi:hypothetical protein WKI65_37620 [Streptomyces sp. MS1.AVA.3]|uniref:hypothetical protein n=1 Tax=Streptomyces decoyicus TaxID=249567 RepID=UPI0030C040AF
MNDRTEGYRPDDVWLLTPPRCSGRCEDGWHLADQPDRDDEPCTVCRGGPSWPLTARPATTLPR